MVKYILEKMLYKYYDNEKHQSKSDITSNDKHKNIQVK